MKQIEVPPGNGRHFYRIYENEDGTVDIYLRPDILPYREENQVVKVLVMKKVVPFDGLEDDIRARFKAWCESAEVIYL